MDKEIIKALECCRKYPLRECKKCPYLLETACDTTLKIDLIDLINRQQAEIENYRRNIKQLTETLTGGNGLRIRVDNMIVYADDLEEWLEFCDKQKADAIKEYKEKLREHAYLDSGITGFQEVVVDLSDIENIADEMVGEGK